MKWDESKHPRVPKGNRAGGRFAPKRGYSSTESDVSKITKSVNSNDGKLKDLVTIDFGFFRGNQHKKEKGIIPEIPREAFGFSRDRIDTNHHKRHVDEMGYKGRREYQEAAIKFWNEGQGDLYYNHRRERFVLFDPKTERVLHISPDGTINTFYQIIKKHFDLQGRVEQYEKISR